MHFVPAQQNSYSPMFSYDPFPSSSHGSDLTPTTLAISPTTSQAHVISLHSESTHLREFHSASSRRVLPWHGNNWQGSNRYCMFFFQTLTSLSPLHSTTSRFSLLLTPPLLTFLFSLSYSLTTRYTLLPPHYTLHSLVAACLRLKSLKWWEWWPHPPNPRLCHTLCPHSHRLTSVQTLHPH